MFHDYRAFVAISSKRFVASAVFLILAAGVFAGAMAQTGGTTNNGDINTLKDLQNIGSDPVKFPLDGTYQLKKDIVVPSGVEFTPIGTWDFPFTGTFDGNTGTIKGLAISAAGGRAVGIFAYVGSSAQIKNVHLEGASVKGGGGGPYLIGATSPPDNWGGVGALVGENDGGTLTNCAVTAGEGEGEGEGQESSITGTANGIGGLVGYNNGGTLAQCYAIASVYGGGNAIGGVVGYNRGSLTDCYTKSVITGGNNGVDGLDAGNGIGGVAGYNDATGTMATCYAKSTVVGTAYVGALVGGNAGSLNQCSALTVAAGVDVTGRLSNVGGLVGYNWGTMTECSSTCSVRLEDADGVNAGGLIGGNAGTVTSCSVAQAPSVEGAAFTGGLVGNNDYGAVTQSVVVNSTVVIGSDSVGGFAGGNGGSLNQCRTWGFAEGSGSNVGGFVGSNESSGTVLQCMALDSVMGSGDNVGGLIGHNDPHGSVRTCAAIGEVDGGGSNVGGLIGGNEGPVYGSFATGTVSGMSGNGVGGLLGDNSGTASQCYATGIVAGGGNAVGGFAGNNDGTVMLCYATGPTSSPGSFVGGLVGYNNGTVTQCYSAGLVGGGHYVGGLVGAGGTINASYWDTATSGRLTSAGGMGKPTAAMMALATFSGWDFLNVWGIVDGKTYPFLRVLPTGNFIVNFIPDAAPLPEYEAFSIDNGVSWWGYTYAGLSPGAYTVTFRPSPGWITPGNQSITIVPGQTVIITATYIGPAAVPDLSLQTRSQASTTLSSAGLVLGAVSSQYSATVPFGEVISQTPVAGAHVGYGSLISILVSSGPSASSVPNVVGLTQTTAQTALTNAGLTVGTISSQGSTTVPAGQVISQSPAAGAPVTPNMSVDLTVSEGPPPGSVPNVVGMTQTDAQTAIANADLTVGSVSVQFSTTVPASQVISQAPAAGTVLTSGSAVYLTVSLGPPPVNVPNVVGMSQPDAQTAITNAGLTPGAVTRQASASVPVGQVISQSPAGGTQAPSGSAVTLVVSSGSPPVSVPNVGGQTQTAAQTLITNAGLTVGTITQQTSTTVAAGQVISQDPVAGTSVAPGTAVNLTVSQGPPLVNVPDVVGATQAAAQTTIANAGLAVGAITQQTSATVPAGEVISQTPAAGTQAVSGSAVDLVVSSGPPPVSVPNVVGQTETDAQTAITNAGLTVGTVSLQSSSTVSSGQVISQNPAAGASVASGTAVNLTVSQGPLPVNVPNVVGQTETAAQTAITNVGLTVGTVSLQSSSTVPSGQVISQDPAAGTSVAPGTAVNLTVSQGPPPVNIPDVVGMTQSAAQAAITNAGLTAGTVTQQTSTTFPAGEVISQTPSGGAQAASGSPVNLVVSSGPPLITVPNVVGQSQTAAQTAITNAGLTVGTVTQQASTTVAAGKVISETPAAGTQAASGSAVNLVVSAGLPLVTVPNVVGQSQTAAQNAITSSGLTVGTVSQQTSATVPVGQVISQTPASGTQAASGSAVNFVISSGPPLSTVPDVMDITQAAAQNAITNAGLTLGTVTQQASATAPVGQVISQSPSPGTQVTSGSAVNLVVSSGPALATVPNVVGQTQTAAQNAITNAGLTVGTVAQQASTTIPAGQVISQTPAAGTQEVAGSAVNLVVSSGPLLSTVPDVVGQSQSAAQTAIAGAGLTVGTVIFQVSKTSPVGQVISQIPAAGTQEVSGSTVNLVISSGPPLATVPNVVGQTRTAAQNAIITADLTVGAVSQQYSATVAAGLVISQDLAAGTSVALGTVVDLTVSQGPAPVSVPNVVGMTQSDADAAIANAGLLPGTVSSQSSSMVAAGNVIGQTPAAGTLLAPGAAVNLVVSSGPPPSTVPNVVGQSQSAAEAVITTAGLTVGAISQEYSDTVAAGDVISQNPPAGTSTTPAMSVDLTVSNGPQPTGGCFGGATNNMSFNAPTGKSGDTALLLSVSATLFLVGSRRRRRLSPR